VLLLLNLNYTHENDAIVVALALLSSQKLYELHLQLLIFACCFQTRTSWQPPCQITSPSLSWSSRKIAESDLI